MATIKVQYVDNINDIVRIDNILYYDISTNNYYRGTEETAISNEIKTYEYLRDLPVFTDAEDCLYYVNQKQNTYILNSEKDKWLQVTLNKNKPEEPTIGTGGGIITGNPFLDIIINSDDIIETSLEEIAMTEETKRAITFKGSFMTILKITADGEGKYKSIELGGMRKVDEYFTIVINNDGTYQIIEEGNFQRINEKVNEIIDDKTGQLYPTVSAVYKYVLENGGGGGGIGAIDSYIQMDNQLEGIKLIRAINADNKIPILFKEFSFNIIQGTFEQTQKDGTLTVEYKFQGDTAWKEAVEYKGTSVRQDEIFNVSINSFLQDGKTSEVRITVTGGEKGATGSISYQIYGTYAQIFIAKKDENFHHNLQIGNTSIDCFCSGENLNKTIIAELDGERIVTKPYGTGTNTIATIPIKLAGKNFGTHHFVLYFVTDDGLESNRIERAIMLDDGIRNPQPPPIINLWTEENKFYLGEPIEINYIVLSVDEEVIGNKKRSTDRVWYSLERLIDNGDRELVYSNELENVQPFDENGNAYIWSYLNPNMDTGLYELTFGAKNNSIAASSIATIQFTVEIPITNFDDLQLHQNNLIYYFNPLFGDNSSPSRNNYEYTYQDIQQNDRIIESTLRDFNFKIDGYQQDMLENGERDDKSLKFIGQGEFEIKIPILSDSYYDKNNQQVFLPSVSGSGRTIEFDFKISNTINPNEQIISCLSEDGVGFVITPSLCYLTSQGQKIDVDDYGFIKNESAISCSYLRAGRRNRVAFVIERVGEFVHGKESFQSINIYVNGKFAQSIYYDSEANFQNNANIIIKAQENILNLYSVLLYSRALDHWEIRHNYCVSPLSIVDKIKRLEANNFTDNRQVEGNPEEVVLYDKAKRYFNCLLIKMDRDGELSREKKKWKKCGIILSKAGPTPEDEPEIIEFLDMKPTGSGAEYVCDQAVQGTTSQRYPIKNSYIRLKKYNPDTKEVENIKFSLQGYNEDGTPKGIEETQFCWKADFMSTEHANTFNAMLANELYTTPLESQNPERGGDSRARSTVYGFRCLFFHQKGDLEPELIGDGALNIDKETPDTFGLTSSEDTDESTKRQKWEYSENGWAIGKFQTDTFFTKKEGQLIPDKVEKVIEPNFPDVDNPNYKHLQIMYTWVVQRANFLEDGLTTSQKEARKRIFLDEFERHFSLERVLTYYLFLEYTAMADNMEKNMFMRSENVLSEDLVFLNGASSLEDCIAEDGTVDASKIDWSTNSTFAIWSPELYDLDTCFGVDNIGKLIVPYYSTWNYTLNGAHVYNGYDSIFWQLVQEAFPDKIAEKARDLSDNKLLNYNSFAKIHIAGNSPYNCPALVNGDMNAKYIKPAKYGAYITRTNAFGESVTEKEFVTEYKYLQRGDRENQKTDFMYKRFLIYDSKYLTQSFINKDNSISFRTRQDIIPDKKNPNPIKDGNFVEITSNSFMYPSARVGMNVQYTDCQTTYIDNSGKKIESRELIPPGQSCKVLIDREISGQAVLSYNGGNDIIDIGDVSRFKPFELTLTQAKKLKRLILGAAKDYFDPTKIYENPDLGNVKTSNCPMLETINIEGCTVNGFTLEENSLIKDINISRSNVDYLSLPVGGFIEKLSIGSPRIISIKNHNFMKPGGFTYDSLNKLEYITIENTPNIEGLQLIKERGLDNIKGVHLVGIDNHLNDFSDFEKFTLESAKGKRLSGDATTEKDKYPIISGDITFNKLYSSQFNKIMEIYGKEPLYPIRITSPIYGKVVFKDYNGDQLKDKDGKVINRTVDVQIGNVNKSIYSAINNSVTDGGIKPHRPVSGTKAYKLIGWSRKQNSASKEDLVNFTKEELNNDDIIEVYAVYSEYGVKEVVLTCSLDDGLLTWGDSSYADATITYGKCKELEKEGYRLVDFYPTGMIQITKEIGENWMYGIRLASYYHSRSESTNSETGQVTVSYPENYTYKTLVSSTDYQPSQYYLNTPISSNAESGAKTVSGTWGINKEIKILYHPEENKTSDSNIKHKFGIEVYRPTIGGAASFNISGSNLKIVLVFYHEDIL